jgi:hypothetical protein
MIVIIFLDTHTLFDSCLTEYFFEGVIHNYFMIVDDFILSIILIFIRSIPDNLSTPTTCLINTEINPRIWPNVIDDDLPLLDGFLSPTTTRISNIQNLSSVNYDHSQSLTNLNKQQNINNNSQLININDEKQLIGPLGSNL